MGITTIFAETSLDGIFCAACVRNAVGHLDNVVFIFVEKLPENTSGNTAILGLPFDKTNKNIASLWQNGKAVLWVGKQTTDIDRFKNVFVSFPNHRHSLVSLMQFGIVKQRAMLDILDKEDQAFFIKEAMENILERKGPYVLYDYLTKKGDIWVLDSILKTIWIQDPFCTPLPKMD